MKTSSRSSASDGDQHNSSAGYQPVSPREWHGLVARATAGQRDHQEMTRARSELRALLRGLAFLSPWLVGFIAFTLVPIALSLYYSFCRYSLLQPPLFKGAENYRDLAGDPVFWKVL